MEYERMEKKSDRKAVRPPRQGVRPPRQGPRREIEAGIEPLVPSDETEEEQPARLPQAVEDKFTVS